MNEERKPPFETHFKLVKIDQTEMWGPAITDRIVGKIYGVYLIDTLEHTYACELQPSYTAYFLYSTWDEDIFDDGLEGEYNRESLDSDIIMGDDFTGAVQYYHVKSIKEWAHDASRGSWSEDDYDDYEQLIEDKIEYYNCNHYV